jgi:sporulation protein YlmC with PRC-barrel domain
MSRPATIRAQELLGRKVYDRDGKKLGRVYDMETGRVGDELRVISLAVGIGTWITRFGWDPSPHGKRIPWADVESFSPHIVVRRQGED